MKLLLITQVVDTQDPVLGFFVRWIQEFSKQYEKVTVICLQKGEYNLPKNVYVYRLGNGHLRRVFGLWRLSIVLRNEYDEVFVHMNPEYIVVAGFIWRFLHKRVALWYTHKSVNIKLRIAVFFSNVVFTASTESFRIASSKVQVIGHGIDTERIIPPRNDGAGVVRLITSGRISEAKGLRIIFDAYLALKARGMSLTLSIFGAPATSRDEIYQEKLFAYLQERGEPPKNIFRGAVPHAEMPRHRTSADYFLHASETGSLDKSVLDAIMSGVLPLSSSGAYHELFAGYDALLQYTPRDSEALATHISALEDLNPSTRDEIRTALRERVMREHSLKALVPRIVDTLRLL